MERKMLSQSSLRNYTTGGWWTMRNKNIRKRTFLQRLRVTYIFITTTKYDKIGKRNLLSIWWWFSAWGDSKILGV